jgi:hypothetical protein
MDKEAFIKAVEEKIKKDGNAISPSDRKTLEEKLVSEIKEARRMKEDFNTEATKMDRECLPYHFFRMFYHKFYRIDFFLVSYHPN